MAKIKLFSFFSFVIALFVIGILIYPYFFVSALSQDVLPDLLNGALLVSVYEEEPEQYLVEGLTAYYQSEEQDISVLFWKFSSKEVSQESKNIFIDEFKAEYDTMFDRVEWDVKHTYQADNYEAVAANFTVYFRGKDYEAGVIAGAIKEYFLVVQIIDYVDKPSLNELLNSLNQLVDNVPGEESLLLPGEEEEPAFGESSAAKEEEEKCGDNNCQYWQGETCQGCRIDCYIDGFCCLPGYSYIYSHDYHNGIYNIHQALAGVIPNGAIIVRPGLGKEDMPLRSASVCKNGAMATGECVFNYDCPSGICTINNECIETYSEEEQEIKDKEMIEKIYKDQTSYKQEYVEAYELMQGGIGQIVIKDLGLNIELEVQGNTAAKVAETNRGDEIETRLTIENDSDYNLALTAAIFYPGYESGEFDLEEKKYTISFKWEEGLSSLIGSFKTKLIGSKFIVMPPGSELIVYSKVVPKNTGYLDVQGLVFFTTEKKYQEWDPGFLNEVPKDYQESEVVETILVKEKPCQWWPICL